MIISEKVTRIRPLLEGAINSSLAASYKRTWDACRKQGNPAPQEPDYIADLSLNWIADFASILQMLFGGRFGIGITGVFCHQKPLADYGGVKDPEVGDLLVVFEYREHNKPPKYNSLLLQAKSTDKPTFQVGTNDLHQLKLYEEWPRFKYSRAGALNGRYRDVHPKCTNSGAKFLLLDPGYINSIGIHGNYPFGCAVPNQKIVLSRDFANELIEFLTFNAGKSISDEQSITEDWSGMIWDLLAITKGKLARRINSGLGRFNRQTQAVSDVAFFMAGNMASRYLKGLQQNGAGRERGYNDDLLDDDGGGISVLYLSIEDNQG